MSVTSWTVGASASGLGDEVNRSVTGELVDLGAIPPQAWAALAERAVEPNAFFQQAWTLAVAEHARGLSGAHALLAWDGPSRKRLIGLLPVVSAWRALKMPIQMLVAWQAYAPLTVPLLDRECADVAARGLLQAAARAGANGVLFPSLASDCASARALHRAAKAFGIEPRAINAHARATLDATQDCEATLKQALGAKKLKERRRQRHRLEDRGEVTFAVASNSEDIAAALDGFLELEISGWKGKQGTALAKHAGDSEFIRQAISGLAAEGRAEIATLSAGGAPVAAGLLLRHNRRAYFFKIAYDEASARMSPGVQLSLEITRHFCADASIDDVDSTAVANHPMIDHIWRGRMQIADVLVPTTSASLSFGIFGDLIAMRSAARQKARSIVRPIRARLRRNR